MIRSIIAVIAGSVVWMVTALGMDEVLRKLIPNSFGTKGEVESVPLLLFMLSYSLLFSVLGGYVTAYIARRNEIQHALILSSQTESFCKYSVPKLDFVFFPNFTQNLLDRFC